MRGERIFYAGCCGKPLPLASAYLIFDRLPILANFGFHLEKDIVSKEGQTVKASWSEAAISENKSSDIDNRSAAKYLKVDSIFAKDCTSRTKSQPRAHFLARMTVLRDAACSLNLRTCCLL
jgi:hypothetical protein